MAFNEQPCPIWDEPPSPDGIPHRAGLYNSPRAGGSFVLEQTGAIWLQWLSERRPLTDKQKINLSYWIFKHNYENGLFDKWPREEDLIVLNQEWVEDHRNRTPSAEDRMLMFLRELLRSDNAGVPPGEADTDFLKAAGGCRHDDDLQELLRYAIERRWLEGGGSPKDPFFPRSNLIKLGLGVRIHVEEELREHDQGSQGFVARWFDCSMNQMHREGIEPAICDAGYRPRQINDKGFTGGVVDEILAEIRKSKFVVADLTSCGKCIACEKCEHIGARGGVYFEAGFALGLGKTVFLTCRKDRAKAVHFDIDHLNRIEWETPEDLREKLKNSILAVLDRGPLISSNGDQEVVDSNSALAAEPSPRQ